MRAVRADGVWRPLLQVRKAEILAFLAELQQPYVTDSTNADTQFRRNFVRHRLMPRLREMNPSVDTTLAATAEHLQEALSVYEVGMSLLDAELLTERPSGRTESISTRCAVVVLPGANGCASDWCNVVSRPR